MAHNGNPPPTSQVSQPNQVAAAPRPPNGWILFRAAKSNELKDPKGKQQQIALSKVISKLWKNLPASEKAYWTWQAELAKREHKKRYPGYKYRPKKREGKAKKGRGKKKAVEAQANGLIRDIQFENYSPGDGGVVASSSSVTLDSTTTSAGRSNVPAPIEDVTFKVDESVAFTDESNEMTVDAQSSFVDSYYVLDALIPADVAYEIGWYSPDVFAAERRGQVEADKMFDDYIAYPEDEV